MTNVLYRELVLAGLTGRLIRGVSVDDFVKKYEVTIEEERRAATVAMKDLMQGPSSASHCVGVVAAVEAVQAIAQRYGFTKAEITNAALSVFQGTEKKGFDGDAEARAEICYHVVRNFLLTDIPSDIQPFSYTGATESFQPPAELTWAQEVRSDLILNDDNMLEEHVLNALPPEIVELYADAGVKLQ